MPRPYNGCDEVLYVRVKQINKKFLEKLVRRIQEVNPSFSNSLFVDQLLDQERMKRNNKMKPKPRRLANRKRI